MDYEIQRCTRNCATSGRELKPGETFYSALVPDGAQLKRYDYSIEAWSDPPEHSVGWWKSQMPTPSAKRLHWAPNDVMIHYFEQLESQAEQHDLRYVLGLLLVRRRVMRIEDQTFDDEGQEALVLSCPRRESTHRLTVVEPGELRTQQIQEELAKLLFAKGD